MISFTIRFVHPAKNPWLIISILQSDPGVNDAYVIKVKVDLLKSYPCAMSWSFSKMTSLFYAKLLSFISINGFI
jgi:hypothetical protein